MSLELYCIKNWDNELEFIEEKTVISISMLISIYRVCGRISLKNIYCKDACPYQIKVK